VTGRVAAPAALAAGAPTNENPLQLLHASGVRAPCAELASSAIVRTEPAWRRWPRFMRTLAHEALRDNPLSARLHVWEAECGAAPDFSFVRKVLIHGAPVCMQGNRPVPRECDWAKSNHQSVLAPGSRRLVQDILEGEVEKGLLLQLPRMRWSALRGLEFFDFVHPMGAVPKMDGTTQVGVRVIQDYSYPPDNSVNDFIDYLPVRYDKVDQAVAFMHKHAGCFAAKIDLSGYFRHIPVDPDDWPLLVAMWDFGNGPVPLIDTRMPFGLRHAPEVCCRLSQVTMHAVQRKLREMGLVMHEDVYVANVVDDWLVLATSQETCLRVWLMLQELLRELGFTINEKPHKLIAPCQLIPWLGLLLDTVAQTVSLPPDKLRKGKELLASFAGRFRDRKPSCTRRALDQLIGYLSYCCAVVYGGRAFLHRIRELRYADAQGHVLKAHHHLHLNKEFRLDVQWWQENLDRFNGQVHTVDVLSSCDVRLDATGDGGLGIFVDGGFASFAPGDIDRLGIGAGRPVSTFSNEWELFNFAVLLRVFGPYLARKTVVVECDNMCSVLAIRKFRASSVHAVKMAEILRIIFSLCVLHQVRLVPVWVAGVDNRLADAFSRQRWRAAGAEMLRYLHSKGKHSPWVQSWGYV
jgi:hypothetical protein